MKNLLDYLNPVSLEKAPALLLPEQSRFYRSLAVNTENNPLSSLDGFKVALLGVPDDRDSLITGSSGGPDAIRRALYPLARIPGGLMTADLGNMKTGSTFNDTIAGLTHIISYLAGKGIATIILGGSTPLLRAADRHFRPLDRYYNLCSVDSSIDYRPEEGRESRGNALAPLFSSAGGRLGHFVNIGYQTYLNDPQVITRLSRRSFDLIRLGEARDALHLTEPCFRDSDIISFSMSAVRYADSPGSLRPSPNGFYAEEVCRLARYAGVSDKMQVFFLLDVSPASDQAGQTAGLAAQILWFLLEGFMQKQAEDPAGADDGSPGGRFVKYHISAGDNGEEMVFIKSNFTERWWMEIKGHDDISHFVACSYEDYLTANANDIPDRWIRAVARLAK